MRILRKIEDIFAVLSIIVMIFFGILLAEGGKFRPFRIGEAYRRDEDED